MGPLGTDPDNFDELVAIERASASLHGRDPERAEETVRARLREIQEKEEREAQYAADKEAERAYRKKRKVIAGLVGLGAILALGAALWVADLVGDAFEREDAFSAALDEVAGPLGDLGLTKAEDHYDADPDEVVLEVPEKTCSAVVAVAEGSREPLTLRVARPTGAKTGAGVHLWCGCQAERVTVVFDNPPKGNLALRWLKASLDTAGGIKVLEDTGPEGAQISMLPGDETCSYAAAAAWATGDGRGQPVPLTEGATVPDGLTPVGRLPAARAFAVMPRGDDLCVLVHPVDDKGQVELRGEDGSLLAKASDTALGWCSAEPTPPITLWRNGPGEHFISRVAASTIGGATGLREVARRLGFTAPVLWLPSGSFGEDALAALAASGVTAAIVDEATAKGLAGGTDKRLVAATLSPEGSLLAPESGGAAYACDPVAEPDAAITTMFCVQAREQAWTGSGPAGSWGAAEGELPTWLWLLKTGDDPKQLSAMAKVLSLARRLQLRGFEPTAIDGVTETVRGATISARKNKTEVVALGITTKAPWFHPLSDGDPWTLDDEPRVMKMPTEGELVAQVPGFGVLSYDEATRDVVIWRR